MTTTMPNISVPETTAPISEQAAGPVSQQVGTPTAAPNAPAVTGPVSSQDEPSEGMQQAQALTASLPAAPVIGAGPAQQSQAQVTALSQKIAQAISLGLAQAPSTQAGWAQLADYFSTSEGTASIEQAQGGQLAAGSQPGDSGSASGAPLALATAPTGLNAFLAAERQQESGGDYTAYNEAGGASGAYQFIQSTWDSEAKAAGYGQYAGRPAGDAPPSVQDAVAAHMASGYFSTYGNWADVAEAWYMPADVGQNVVPDPGAGNRLSVTQYGQQVMALMGAMPQQDQGAPAAGNTNSIVRIAQTQLGTPYVWGGEDPDSPGHPGAFDCSGLVQWVFGQAGVQLPRVAQAQYNATAKLPGNAPLQPGDLLFFGSGTSNITHVGIYIGNGQMIDAPHTGADVRIDDNPTGWADYVGATRPTDASGASTLTGSMDPNLSQTALQSQQNYGALLNQVTDALTQMYQTYPGAGTSPVGEPVMP